MNVIDQKTMGQPDRLPPNGPATQIGRVPVDKPKRYKGIHRRPSSRKFWLSLLGSSTLVAFLGAGSLVVAGSPAHAAIARCNTTQTVYTGAYTKAHIYMPSSSDAYWSINCYMNRGETGNEVRALQMALNQCYGKALSVDGQFGPRTQQALVEAQRSHGFTSGLGRYTDREAWSLRFWGARGVHFVCARLDGPILT